MNELEQLTLTAETGEEARRFMESRLGVALLEKADAQVHEAVCKFADTPLDKAADVAELQLRIRMGMAFGQWLEELVQAGNEAISLYQQMQRTE